MNETENPLALVLRAADFAARAHAGQVRKGAVREPYIVHPIEVAGLVAQAGADPEVVAAAFLHDVVEDCGVSLDELREAFGERVAGIVAEVTDDKSLDKKRRKDLQIEHAAHASQDAQVVKLADKTSNVRALKSSPPDWPPERIAAYAAWAAQVVDPCRPASAFLASSFDEAAEALLATAP